MSIRAIGVAVAFALIPSISFAQTAEDRSYPSEDLRNLDISDDDLRTGIALASRGNVTVTLWGGNQSVFNRVLLGVDTAHDHGEPVSFYRVDDNDDFDRTAMVTFHVDGRERARMTVLDQDQNISEETLRVVRVLSRTLRTRSRGDGDLD